jgi:dipeptidyl aminopeptidase B
MTSTWCHPLRECQSRARTVNFFSCSYSRGASHIQVTYSGNATLFHGVPDWVYEEEVLSNDHALWWSPDSSKIAFLVLDETLVNEYTYPIYNPTDDSDAVVAYPLQLTMRYPKPGFPNPFVSAHVFDLERFLSESHVGGGLDPPEATLELEWVGRMPSNDSIIMEVVWLGNDALLLKEVNRNADAGSAVLFDISDTSLLGARVGLVVRKFGEGGEEADEGWIDSKQTVYPLLESFSASGLSSYLDIVPDQDGYNHIALFSPASATTPRFLTTGPWEVTSGIQAVDLEKGLVYASTGPELLRHNSDRKDLVGTSKLPIHLPSAATYSPSAFPSMTT